MEYITINEAAEKWEISARRIQVLCAQNRIDGIRKFGHAWAIPENANKPTDARIKTGKYIKERKDKNG